MYRYFIFTDTKDHNQLQTNYIMQNRLIHIVLYFIACCFSSVAISNNSHLQAIVSPEAKSSNTSVVRELFSRSRFVRITFLDDSCDTICGVNKGITHFESSEYLKSQKEKLNQMSFEILKVFSEEELVDFNDRKIFHIMCELTVRNDGKIVNTSLIIPAKFSAEVSDQKLRDIKEIISQTQLDEIPHNPSAVRFYHGIPSKLIVQLLESKN